MGVVRVNIPATSANLGSGFDSLGMALTLYNTIEVEEREAGLEIFSADGTQIPTDQSNLVYRTLKKVYEDCGAPLPGFSIRQLNEIPMARGLGSSSACIAGAVTAANELLGRPLSLQEMLDAAVREEGHPDNVMPAFLGGFVAAVWEEGHVSYIRREVKGLEFAALIPDFQLLTSEARAALPPNVLHRDAVYNLSRAALAAAAFCTGEYDLLTTACKDRLHQPYRLPLIDQGEALFRLAENSGATAWFISGAGPTILAVVREGDSACFQKLQAGLEEDKNLRHFRMERLRPDNQGVCTVQ